MIAKLVLCVLLTRFTDWVVLRALVGGQKELLKEDTKLIEFFLYSGIIKLAALITIIGMSVMMKLNRSEQVEKELVDEGYRPI